jgi:hypothetical protein
MVGPQIEFEFICRPHAAIASVLFNPAVINFYPSEIREAACNCSNCANYQKHAYWICYVAIWGYEPNKKH